MVTFKEILLEKLKEKPIKLSEIQKKYWMHWISLNKMERDIKELIAENRIKAVKLSNNDFEFSVI